MTLPSLFIGIDGGQTSTKCVLATSDLRVLGEGSGGGLLHLAAADGERKFLDGLSTAVQSAWQSAKIDPQPVRAMVMGLTGVDAPLEAQRAEALARQIVECRNVRAVNDALIACAGAHAGQPGIIVISGTGAIAFGKDATGRTARAGGWGWLIGDEGSAMAIGRDGLMAVTNAYDGTGPHTNLMVVLMQHLNIADLKDCKRIVYAPDFGSRGFAALAPLVSTCAQQGDRVAQGIIAQAGAALAQLAEGVAHALDLPRTRVAPVSGAFEHVYGLRQAFAQSLSQSSTTQLDKISPIYSAAMGALLIARDIDSQVG